MAASAVGEEEHGVVHGGGVDLLDEVVVPGAACLHAYASSPLCTELCQGGALDVAHVADGHHHLVVGIEVLGVELVGVGHDFRAAHVTELLLHFQQFVLDDLAAQVVVGEYLVEVLYLLHQFVILGMQLVLLQTGEL